MTKKQWTGKDVEKVLLLAQDIISLETPVSTEDDNDTVLADFLVDTRPNPEDVTLQNARRDTLLTYVDKFLSEREARVIKMRFGFETASPMTLEEIGEEFGVCRERVRQIEFKALRKLRYKFMRHKLQMEDI